MQIQYTKNLNPGRFELGTTLNWPNTSICELVTVVITYSESDGSSPGIAGPFDLPF